MKYLINYLFISILMVLATPLYVIAGTSDGTIDDVMDGTGVMQKVLQAFYYQGKDLRATAHMQIVDKQGRKRIREFTILRLNTEQDRGKQKYYVYFIKPSDVKKLVFMAWKNVERDDDRWLYLPALDLVKRIAASDERTSFVGSHFYYEDVSGRGLSEDTHQLEKETDHFYLLTSTPKKPEAVGFSYYRTWVDKKTYLPMKVDYYQNDKIYRQYQTIVTNVIEGYPTIVKAQMQDKRTGGITTIDYSAVTYAQGIPEKIFSERYLRKAPKKYLK